MSFLDLVNSVGGIIAAFVALFGAYLGYKRLTQESSEKVKYDDHETAKTALEALEIFAKALNGCIGLFSLSDIPASQEKIARQMQSNPDEWAFGFAEFSHHATLLKEAEDKAKPIFLDLSLRWKDVGKKDVDEIFYASLSILADYEAYSLAVETNDLSNIDDESFELLSFETDEMRYQATHEINARIDRLVAGCRKRLIGYSR